MRISSRGARTGLIASVSTALLVGIVATGGAAPATADSVAHGHAVDLEDPAYAGLTADERQELEACEEAVVASGADWWVCAGSAAIITTIEGSERSDVTVVIGETSTGTPMAEPLSTSTDPSVSREESLSSGSSEAVLDFEAAATWCSLTYVCYETNDYLSRASGRQTYGNNSGVVGSYDLDSYTRLEGRAPQWRVRIDHRSGPGLTFSGASQNCRQFTTVGTRNCGERGAFRGETAYDLNTGTWSNTSYAGAAPLKDGGSYYSFLRHRFTPDGGPLLASVDIRGLKWTCPSSGNCTGWSNTA